MPAQAAGTHAERGRGTFRRQPPQPAAHLAQEVAAGQVRHAPEHDPPAPRQHVEDLVDGDDDEPASQHAHADDERIGLVRARAKHDQLDQPESSGGRVDAEAFAPCEPVDAAAEPPVEIGVHRRPFYLVDPKAG